MPGSPKFLFRSGGEVGWSSPEREVMFARVHEPGEAAQSDFTHMTDLGVTLGCVPFPHLAYHLVLVYSNIEAVQICLSESFEPDAREAQDLLNGARLPLRRSRAGQATQAGNTR